MKRKNTSEIVRLFKTIPVIFFVLIIQLPLKGQYYNIGQAPASTRWNFIETPDFKIIYPDFLEETAANTAFLFQAYSVGVQSGLRTKTAKTPVILHPQDVLSNAFAIWAPRRIEVLTTPPQKSYAHPWLNQLALHEYRHIVQLSKLNQGVTKGLSYLFGQQAHAVSAGLFVPSWFLEGDAVTTETLLSKSGRGRVPAFSQTFRAQLAEKGPYSYQKAALGSYKNHVPDIYTTGYHIVAFAREKYGPEIWNSAMDAVARKPYLIAPFNNGLKKVSGLNKRGIYKETISDLNEKWESRQKGDAQYIEVKSRKGEYINYLNPVQSDDSTVVALKTSFSRPPEIVKISQEGSEQILYRPGYIPDNIISFNGGWMAWAEYRPHPRWQTVSNTDILFLNPTNGEVKRRSFNRKLYSPVALGEGLAFAAVEYEKNGNAFISIISEDDEIKFPVPEDVHPITPAWGEEGKSIIFIAVDDSGKKFMKLDIESREFSEISRPEYSEISDPYVADGWIYYTGSVGDKSQILRMNLSSKKTEVLTASAYGAARPQIYNNSLIYNDYTADGNRISRKSLNNVEPMAYSKSHPEDWIRVNKLTEQETFAGIDTSADTIVSSGKYSKARNLFHIHSWAPVYADITGETARPGFSVMSQNLLSTMFVTAGYDYDMNEQTGMFRTNVSWKGWFPEFKAGISTGKRAGMAKDTTEGILKRFTWDETNLDLSVGQALDFSKGNINKGLYGETTFTYSKITHDESTPENIFEGNLSTLSYRMFGYVYVRQALRDLAPRFGFNADVRFRHALFGLFNAENIAAFQTQIFLPGLLLNHSTGFYAGYQRSHPQRHLFQNIVGTSRGYIMMDRANELLSLKLNYRFPLFYPDFHAAGLIYVKRLRANLFHDYTKVAVNTPAKIYQSSGMDLMADFHLFGISIPVSAGGRGIYLHGQRKMVYELLFSINFYDY
ncbi:MAG: DUF5050 domain-containing protein [Lentimicrobium sp.]|nr:DUF5050 domain-containing protein [Lentimicrobium sp.]